jgi:cytochrome c-type biogenesis protein CcmH/NrfG
LETDLATCFHYLGQEDRALQILDNVLRYSPGFTQAKFNKGIVLIEGKKDVKNGVAVWEDLLRSDPNYSQREQLEQRIRQLKESAR